MTKPRLNATVVSGAQHARHAPTRGRGTGWSGYPLVQASTEMLRGLHQPHNRQVLLTTTWDRYCNQTFPRLLQRLTDDVRQAVRDIPPAGVELPCYVARILPGEVTYVLVGVVLWNSGVPIPVYLNPELVP